MVLIQQGKVEEAESEFQRALRANPALANVRQHLARLYLAQGKEDEAVVELRRAAETAALERDLALKLAAVEQAAGHPALAERQLRSAAERFQSVRRCCSWRACSRAGGTRRARSNRSAARGRWRRTRRTC